VLSLRILGLAAALLGGAGCSSVGLQPDAGTSGDAAGGGSPEVGADGAAPPEAGAACVNSLGCPQGLVCDTTAMLCVQCVRSGDCAAGETCVGDLCRKTCASDLQCTPLGMLCNQSLGLCVSCLVATDCPAGEYCAGGSCRPAICSAGASMCQGNAVARCRPDGSGYDLDAACAAGLTCSIVNGAAACGTAACPTGATCGDGVCTASCESVAGCGVDCGALVFTAGDARRIDTGDWALNSYKAECGAGQALIGLSVGTSSNQAHAALCSPDSAATVHGAATGCHTLNFAGGDGGMISSDWDYGHYKAECAPTEFVAGVAQDTSGALTDILCCPGQVTHQACAALILGAGEVREAGAEAASGDWDYGYYKGECSPGRYVAGVSRNVSGSGTTPITGAAHGMLCCSP
jgi:hypothetical protein